MHLLSFMCFLWPVLTILARQCGFPGQLEKGTVFPIKKTYNEGELVTYTCDRGYYFKYDSQFLKTAQRTCQDNGLWDGTIPACDYYDIISNAFIIPLGLNNITDDCYQTCVQVNRTTFTYRQATEISALFRTVHSGPIHILVHLDTRRGLPRQTIVSVQVMDYPNQCSLPSISNSGMEFSSTCNITNKGDNHGVRLTFPAWNYWSQASSLSICSFKGLILTGPGCEELQRPANGTVSRNSSNIATYYCDEGYEILGKPQRKCAWSAQRNKYHWTETAPVCAPKSVTNLNLTFPIPTATANEKMCASPILNTISWSLLVIGVTMTIFNVIYCLVRCVCQNIKKTRARPHLEVNDQYAFQNQAMRVEPEVLPLNNLPREGRNLPANSGRCSTNEQNTYSMNEDNIYATIEELAVFSTSQTTTAEHLSKNKDPCSGAVEGGQDATNVKTHIQEHSFFTYANDGFSSNAKKIPTNAMPQSDIPLRTRKPKPKSKSGKFQSKDPEPSSHNEKSDYSEPLYGNIPKKT